MKTTINILAFIFSLYWLNAEVSVIDTVYISKFGINTQYGQSVEFFPNNIFTIPPQEASKNAPASQEKDICSIGLDGEIVVGFKNRILIDVNGIDFVVFENAFINPVTKKMFAEPGIVSVSKDGIDFLDFPIDSNELYGCAGISHTNGNQNIFNPAESGGDQFDLKTIGLDYIKFIKIKDFTSYLLNNPKHKFYDAILSGFDLDCIIGFNLVNEQLSVSDDITDIEITESNDHIIINKEADTKTQLYSINGNLIYSTNERFINKSNLQTGMYFLLISQNDKILRKKVIKY